MGSYAVDTAWDDEGEELLAAPHGLGLEDTRHGHVPVPARQEHQQVHHLLLSTREM